MSAPTGLVLPRPGLSQPEFWATYLPEQSSASGTLTANQAHMVRLPRLAKAQVFTNGHIFVVSSNGNLDIAIYSDDGAQYARMASTGSTAVSGTNAIQTVALSSSFTAMPGVDYWATLVLDGTASIARIAGLHAAFTGFRNRVLAKASANIPAPATIAYSPGGTANVPWIGFS